MNQSVLNNITTTLSPSVILLSGFTWSSLSKVIVSGFSILTNLINIAVFLHPKLKDTSYKYMLLISISNFFYSLFSFINNITSTCTTCSTIGTFFAAFASLYLSLYAAAVLAFFRTTTECTVALYTYCILTNHAWLTPRVNSYKLIATGMFLFAATLYSFTLFGISIGGVVDANGNTQFSSIRNSFALSQYYSNFSIAVNSIRLSLVAFVLTALNILNLIEFRKRYKTRIFGLAKTNNNTQDVIVNSTNRSIQPSINI